MPALDTLARMCEYTDMYQNTVVEVVLTVRYLDEDGEEIEQPVWVCEGANEAGDILFSEASPEIETAMNDAYAAFLDVVAAEFITGEKEKDMFKTMFRWGTNVNAIVFIAGTGDNGDEAPFSCILGDGEKLDLLGEGPTPEEAVAACYAKWETTAKGRAKGAAGVK